jgi:ribonuclease P protein component
MLNAARLRRTSDIAAVRADGRTAREAAFSSRSRPNDLGVVRIAVSAPRNVGPAVTRNRARRRVREAFRTAIAAATAHHGVDLVVMARREAISADFPSLRRWAEAALRSAGVTQ